MSAVLIIVGIVCGIIFGFGADGEFNGYDRYSAPLAKDFDISDADKIKLIETLNATLPDGGSAEIVTDYKSGVYQIVLTGISPFEPDTAAIKNILAKDFPEMEMGEFSTFKTAPSKNLFSLLFVAGGFVLVLLVVWLVAMISVGFSDSFAVLIAAAHDILLVVAFCVFMRVGDLKILIGCGLLAAVLSLYFNTAKLTVITAAFQRNTKNPEASVIAASRELFERTVSFVAFAALLAVGVAIASLALGETALIPVAVACFVALCAGAYSSGCITPNLWMQRRK